MGEIANDMMMGHCCSFCSTYFKAEHGYPVLCIQCYIDTAPRERGGLQCATIPELGSEDSDDEMLMA